MFSRFSIKMSAQETLRRIRSVIRQDAEQREEAEGKKPDEESKLNSASSQEVAKQEEVKPCSCNLTSLQRSCARYENRRNALTLDDNIDFKRFHLKRVQQRIIDTYVYGWRWEARNIADYSLRNSSMSLPNLMKYCIAYPTCWPDFCRACYQF